ncbi:MAG: hypothetical protein E7035_02225 [Verrucomicrobiaceae bacterium]|nr:hypothetical protein [Verrucomicrobiaceae bacterium]
MKVYIKSIIIALTSLLAVSAGAEVFKLQSPNGKLQVEIDVNKCFTISAKMGDRIFLKEVKASMKTPRTNICAGLPYSLDRRFHRGDVPSEDFNQLEYSYTNNGYKVYVRAYNDAVAYRVEIKDHPKTEVIISEQLDIAGKIAYGNVKEAPFCFWNATGEKTLLNQIVFVETSDADYPSMKIKYPKGVGISTDFKKYKSDDEFEPTYIYKLNGKAKKLPWRAFTSVYGYADPQIKNLKLRLEKYDNRKKN